MKSKGAGGDVSLTVQCVDDEPIDLDDGDYVGFSEVPNLTLAPNPNLGLTLNPRTRARAHVHLYIYDYIYDEPIDLDDGDYVRFSEVRRGSGSPLTLNPQPLTRD